MLTKPGPTLRGGPNVKLVVKTVAELTAIAKKAAKEGKPVEKIYPHFMRDVQRRFKQGPERNAIIALSRGKRLDNVATETKAYVRQAPPTEASAAAAGLSPTGEILPDA